MRLMRNEKKWKERVQFRRHLGIMNHRFAQKSDTTEEEQIIRNSSDQFLILPHSSSI